MIPKLHFLANPQVHSSTWKPSRPRFHLAARSVSPTGLTCSVTAPSSAMGLRLAPRLISTANTEKIKFPNNNRPRSENSAATEHLHPVVILLMYSSTFMIRAIIPQGMQMTTTTSAMTPGSSTCVVTTNLEDTSIRHFVDQYCVRRITASLIRRSPTIGTSAPPILACLSLVVQLYPLHMDPLARRSRPRHPDRRSRGPIRCLGRFYTFSP